MLKLIPQPIRQYAQFHGRMTRSQYFRWLGFLLVVYIICAWVDLRFIAPTLGYLPFEEVEEQYLTIAAGVLLVVPWLASGVRRLHDVNRRGWWMLLGIFPFLIAIFYEEMGFSLYGLLTEGLVSELLPADLAEMAINSMPWVIIGIGVLCFSPVIILNLIKGSGEPNQFGVRD
ncbi:MAG: DUF805 domain-containing protein [Rhizobiaceae bacterium]|nr:DUF805 domain-containing protein [Rhizobiaceae bacterium]